MSDEKNKYSVIGTVTIGADEYRDLIEEVAEAKRREEYADRRRWEAERKIDDAESKVTNAAAELVRTKAMLENAMAFINETKSRKIAYLGFANELVRKANEND